MLFLLNAVFLLSCAGTWGLMVLAPRCGLVDVPNRRSSHDLPTPRGGGLALVLVFYLGGGYLALTGGTTVPHLLGLGICGLGIVAAGLADDLFRLSPAKRIILHFACTAGAVYFFLPVEKVFTSGGIVPLFVVRVLLVVGIVWLLNLYNFMDGIDGIAGGEAVSATLGAGLILLLRGETADHLPLLLVLTAASLGFLVWNLPPARIFMGDAGSGFLGFCFGILAILTASATGLNLWSWIILLGTFIADATVTLFVRLMRGEKIYQAHRSHAYQILARRTGSHGRVTFGYMGANWLFLFPLALLAAFHPGYGLVLVIFSYAPLVLLCILIGAGRTND
ncbi:MAG TPA: glycosyltransferase family 4 protein [Desulfobacteraceae bacterium]|nr:glycosyltransferase family 4 protein [Desulfobacteraceae bacterium]